MLWFNIGWLLFIILLPFNASLVSAYFFDRPAILFYSLNVLFITNFQNMIWDYVALREGYLDEKTAKETIYDFRFTFNVAMVNVLLAVAICFFSPLAAFIILFTRLPMLIIAKYLFKKAEK